MTDSAVAPPAEQTPPPAETRPEPGPVPYDRFKAVNDELKDLRDKFTQLEAAAKTKTEAELAEQQRWQELADSRKAAVETAQQENLRLRVAMEKQLPPELIDRLRGDTRETLLADADSLLQFIKPGPGPGVPPVGRGSGSRPLDINTMTPEEIRKNKDKLLQQPN